MNTSSISVWSRRPALRRLAALAYTALLLVLLLQSSAQPLLGPPAPPGPPPLERELLMSAGHLAGFALLTFIWRWALGPTVSDRRALGAAVSLGLALAVVTEAAQTAIPDRSASLLDLAANLLAVAVTAWAIAARRR